MLNLVNFCPDGTLALWIRAHSGDVDICKLEVFSLPDFHCGHQHGTRIKHNVVPVHDLANSGGGLNALSPSGSVATVMTLTSEARNSSLCRNIHCGRQHSTITRRKVVPVHDHAQSGGGTKVLSLCKRRHSDDVNDRSEEPSRGMKTLHCILNALRNGHVHDLLHYVPGDQHNFDELCLQCGMGTSKSSSAPTAPRQDAAKNNSTQVKTEESESDDMDEQAILNFAGHLSDPGGAFLDVRATEATVANSEDVVTWKHAGLLLVGPFTVDISTVPRTSEG